MTAAPTTSRMTMVALGVSVASLVYSASLAVQRFVPGLKDALMVNVDGVKPTYYLRVLSSLVIGGIVATLGRRLVISERRLAWGTSIAIAASVVLVCAFP